MTKARKQLLDYLADNKLSQQAFADLPLIQSDRRTVGRWCRGEVPVPHWVTGYIEADFYARFGGGPRTIARRA